VSGDGAAAQPSHFIRVICTGNVTGVTGFRFPMARLWSSGPACSLRCDYSAASLAPCSNDRAQCSADMQSFVTRIDMDQILKNRSCLRKAPGMA
jgi:hypothetical protein